MADTEAAEGPGVGHEQRSRIGGRWERRSHPLTGRRSTQRNRIRRTTLRASLGRLPRQTVPITTSVSGAWAMAGRGIRPSNAGANSHGKSASSFAGRQRRFASGLMSTVNILWRFPTVLVGCLLLPRSNLSRPGARPLSAAGFPGAPPACTCRAGGRRDRARHP